MKYEILNHYTRAVMLTADIDCDESTPDAIKMRKAVEWALKNNKSLRGAYLFGANLSRADLREADLCGANLSQAYLRYAGLSAADLRGADLRGADLSWANPVEADLRFADLSGANLRFANLVEADLSYANLREANLHWADLSWAKLHGAAIDINIPVIPNIHQKVYEAASKPGALDMSKMDSFNRAGWVVTLAGEDGKALKEKLGTSAAAALIYFKSDPELEKTPDFYCDNEYALFDMKALAEKEAQQ